MGVMSIIVKTVYTIHDCNGDKIGQIRMNIGGTVPRRTHIKIDTRAKGSDTALSANEARSLGRFIVQCADEIDNNPER